MVGSVVGWRVYMLPFFAAEIAQQTAEVLAEDELITTNLERFVLVITVALSVATLPQVFSWARHIPYTLLLVITGLGLALVDVRLVNLSPELILTIFLPPLLFEAAWNLKWSALRRELVPVILFAVLGVVISVGGIGWGLHQFGGMGWPIALLIGASLAATDPVSVIALFRELGVGERLRTLMEGESLLNDGVAVVAFGLLVGIPLGLEEFDVQVTVLRFITFVGIGIGVGGLIGFGISYLTQRFDLPLVEQSLTLTAAYATYLVAEELGGSGVIGVVVTGLVLGNFGSRIGMNPRTRVIVSEFWEFLAFFVNSIVFLLIGDQIEFNSLITTLPITAITIVAMIGARWVVIFGLGFLSNTVAESPIGWRDQTVLWWGGLRGSVAIALALSVPTALPERNVIIAIVFGVVLFTLLVQGLSIKPLLQGLNLLGDQPLQQRYQELLARRVAMQRVMTYLEDIEEDYPDRDPELHRYQRSLVKAQLEDVREDMDKLTREYPNLKLLAAEQLREKLLNIEAETYAELVRVGQLNRELSPYLEITIHED